CGFFPFAVEGLDPELSPRVGDGLVRVDSEGKVLYASPNATSAYRRLGIMSSIVDEPFAALGIDATPMLSALERGSPAESEAASGDTIVLQRAIPFIAPNRRVEGAMILVRDVTELRHRDRMLQRKEAAIREIHHRVKNNLQTIASLLRIQARRLEAPDVKRELEEAVKRIQAIAVVHETLTREGGEAVEFAPVVRKLVDMVSAGLIDSARTIQISVEGEAGRLPTELATPLAVVLVELIQNAVQHAFDDDGGKVRVRMWREEERVRLEVADDGRGLPRGFRLEDGGVGFQIVRALVTGELEGSIRLDSDGGTTVGMDLPLSRARR
ncbi:MAG: sensor histidine kinase, partial [Actinomycetota bacterium]